MTRNSVVYIGHTILLGQRNLRLTGNVTRMGETRNAYRIMWGKFLRASLLERRRDGWN